VDRPAQQGAEELHRQRDAVATGMSQITHLWIAEQTPGQRGYQIVTNGRVVA
jgi:hypothetical protein